VRNLVTRVLAGVEGGEAALPESSALTEEDLQALLTLLAPVATRFLSTRTGAVLVDGWTSSGAFDLSQVGWVVGHWALRGLYACVLLLLLLLLLCVCVCVCVCVCQAWATAPGSE
jgi:hypothetical protein